MEPTTELIRNEAANYDFRGAMADFNSRPVIDESALSPAGKKMLDVYKPYTEAIDWDNPEKGIRGPKAVRDKFKDTYKMLVAEQVHKMIQMSGEQIRKESMVAGTDSTTYHKQIIRTVLRAYPRLIAPQLVPVVPMTGPTARIYFELMKYDTAFASSSPNISVGDTMDDLAKFNSGYAAQAAQLTDLNAIKLSMENYIEISETTHGLSATSSLQFEDDIETVHGMNYNNYMSDKLFSMLQWFVDRQVVYALYNAVPAANSTDWDRHPTINSVLWANQAPSEQKSWREELWSQAILPAMNQIYTARYEFPNFMLCGRNAANDIRALAMFQPIDVFNPNSVNIQTGGVRDLGTLDSGQLRVLVDPQLSLNTIVLGIRPMEAFKPAVCWCPYRAIKFAEDLYYPRSLKHEKGAYTRFGIAKPAGDSISAHLGDGYSKIVITQTS